MFAYHHVIFSMQLEEQHTQRNTEYDKRVANAYKHTLLMTDGLIFRMESEISRSPI